MKFKRSSLGVSKMTLPHGWDYALRTQIGRYGKINADALGRDRVRKNEMVSVSTHTVKKVKDPMSAAILLVINPNNAIVCKAEV